MEPGGHFDDTLRQLTEGLRRDTERRLDVMAELRGHLRDRAAEFRADGFGDSESCGLAVRAFGPPDQIAPALAAANRPRMRRRAWGRGLLRIGLVPASVLLAVYLALGALADFSTAQSVRHGIGHDRKLAPWLRFMHRIWPGASRSVNRLGPGKVLLFRGDPARPGRGARMRALWEDNPHSAPYFGWYLTHLLAEYSEKEVITPEDMAFFESEVRKGLALEPDNGRPLLALAAIRMRDAAATVAEHVGTRDGRALYAWHLDVRDRESLARAMAEFRRGVGLPKLRRYSMDVLREQLALMPRDTIGDWVVRNGIVAGLLQPDVVYYRELARAAPLYAELLLREGRREEAEPYLELWYPLVVKLNRDAFALIDLLMAEAIARQSAKECARVYRRIGKPNAAQGLERKAYRLMAPMRAWRVRHRAYQDAHTFQRHVRRHAGMIDRYLLPVLGEELTEADLAPNRELDYVLLERGVTVLLLVLLAVVILGALLVSLRWRFARGEHILPMLLVPTPPRAAFILGLGAATPILLYFAYTRASGLAGREYALAWHLPRAVMEMLTPVVLVLTLIVLLAIRAARRRCRVLGVPVPPMPARRWVPALTGFLALWAGSWIWLYGAWRAGRATTDLAVLMLLGPVAVGGLALLVGAFGAKRVWGPFYGTAARSLLLVAAGAILTVAALTQPYLRMRERTLVRSMGSTTDVGFTRVETRLVRRLQGEIAEIADEIKRETSGR
jgi:hypothetical protein